MNVRLMVFVSLAGLVTAGGLSCATQKSTTQGAPETAEEQGPVVGPPEVAWKDMTHEQRGTYMKKVVQPRMAQVFRAFDPEEFKEFRCATCHGKDAKERDFKMPNPHLKELPTTEEGFQELMQKKPEWMKFMGQQVKPEMAKLLGLPEYDPKNPQPGQFGCGACHPMAGH